MIFVSRTENVGFRAGMKIVKDLVAVVCLFPPDYPVKTTVLFDIKINFDFPHKS